MTESSTLCWVVALLYTDGKVECSLLEEKLRIVAGKNYTFE